MYKKINGNKISKILYEELKKYLLTKDKLPYIVDISIGNDFGGHMYAEMKKKKINKETGINFESIHFEEITYEELKQYIKDLNNNENVTGIMVQLPLPNYLKKYERDILDTINPNKDIDGLTSIQAGLLTTGSDTIIPCTALGIEVLLKTYDVELTGKRVAIINRSNIVGKPLMQLMLKNNATPIICHSKTKNLADITRQCDIIIAALNKQEYITKEHIKEDTIIIDVGVHKNKLGKTVGDVDLTDVYDKVNLITPPIGGVGPMTICMLAYNAAKAIYKKDIDELLQVSIKKAQKLM